MRPSPVDSQPLVLKPCCFWFHASQSTHHCLTILECLQITETMTERHPSWKQTHPTVKITVRDNKIRSLTFSVSLSYHFDKYSRPLKPPVSSIWALLLGLDMYALCYNIKREALWHVGCLGLSRFRMASVIVCNWVLSIVSVRHSGFQTSIIDHNSLFCNEFYSFPLPKHHMLLTLRISLYLCDWCFEYSRSCREYTGNYTS